MRKRSSTSKTTISRTTTTQGSHAIVHSALAALQLLELHDTETTEEQLWILHGEELLSYCVLQIIDRKLLKY